jgi:hypothetical protein
MGVYNPELRGRRHNGDTEGGNKAAAEISHDVTFAVELLNMFKKKITLDPHAHLFKNIYQAPGWEHSLPTGEHQKVSRSHDRVLPATETLSRKNDEYHDAYSR